MTHHIGNMSQRSAGIIAGVGFVITLVGVILASIGGVAPGLIVPGDAVATANKIVASGGLFRAGIIGWLIAIIGDVVRAWALYVFFKRVNKSVALLAAWWMLLHDAIFGFANTCLVVVSEFLGGSGYFAGLALDTVHPLMMLLLKMHYYGFEIGLFFFSFHLLLLGYLVLQSGYVPRIAGHPGVDCRFRVSHRQCGTHHAAQLSAAPHQHSCVAQHYRRISTCGVARIQGRKDIFRRCNCKKCLWRRAKKMMIKKVCIVGASGKLGRYMVQHALDRGYEVVGVCRERSVGRLDAFKGHITVIPGATNDREVIKQAVAGCDGVLTVLVPWGVHQYSSGTAQAVLDHARPGARLIFSCG